MIITGPRAAREYAKRFGDSPIEIDLEIIDHLRDGYLEFDTETEKLRTTESGMAYLWCSTSTMH